MRKLVSKESANVFASGISQRLRKQMIKCHEQGKCARYYRMLERHGNVM